MLNNKKNTSIIQLFINNLKHVCEPFDSTWIQRKRKFDTFNVIHQMMLCCSGIFGGLSSISNVIPTQTTSTALFLANKRISIGLLRDIYNKYLKSSVALYTSLLVGKKQHYRLLAVDGSKVKLGPGMNGEFPIIGSSKLYPQCMISSIYDCELKLPIYNELFDHHNERKAFVEQLDSSNMFNFSRDIFVFDRGYHSQELVNLLEKRKVSFIFRLKKNANKLLVEAIESSVSKNEKLDSQCRTLLECGNGKRIVHYRLESTGRRKHNEKGNVSDFYLLTNLDEDVFSNDMVKTFYKKRWNIEVSFKEMKSNLGGNKFKSKSLMAMKKELLYRSFALVIVKQTQFMHQLDNAYNTTRNNNNNDDINNDKDSSNNNNDNDNNDDTTTTTNTTTTNNNNDQQ